MIARLRMVAPYVGDSVLFVGLANSFRGMRGIVKVVVPHVMILVEGDRLPMRFRPDEFAVLHDEGEPSMTGAE